MRTLFSIGLCLVALLTQSVHGEDPPVHNPFKASLQKWSDWNGGALTFQVPYHSAEGVVWLEPSAAAAQQKIDHMLQAAEHLKAAGLIDQAAQIRQQAQHEERLLQHRELKEKLVELEKLQAEVDRLRRVTGQEPQVLVHVKVLEVSVERLRQHGVEIGKLTGMAKGGIQTVSATDDEKVLPQLIDEKGVLRGIFQALRQKGLVKVLAEPTILTTSGRPATMISGGEFPIPKTKGGQADDAAVEWREFGTRLDVLPTVLGDGRLRLELSPEISERDFSNAVHVEGKVVPGLTTRRINTQLEMQAGETAVLGGMTSNVGKKGPVELIILVRCDLVDSKGHPAEPQPARDAKTKIRPFGPEPIPAPPASKIPNGRENPPPRD